MCEFSLLCLPRKERFQNESIPLNFLVFHILGGQASVEAGWSSLILLYSGMMKIFNSLLYHSKVRNWL